MIFTMRSVNQDANPRVNFSAISFGDTVVALRRPCIISAQFLFGDTMIRRCGGEGIRRIAIFYRQHVVMRMGGGSAAFVRKFSAIFLKAR